MKDDSSTAPGSHTLVVDYVERGGIAKLQLSFSLLYVGKPLPDGTYYYVITYTLLNGRTEYLKGNVTILR